MTTPTPSPWSAPRPDGPLAAALRDAQAHRAQAPAGDTVPADIPIEVLPDLPQLGAETGSPEVLQHDIEQLARDARARDAMREALAVALEWPQEGRGGHASRRTRRWWGWMALGGMVVLAGAAATVVSMSGEETLPVPLKLEKSLSLPR